MALKIGYQDFFLGSFLAECRKQGLQTNDLLLFVNSLMGVENFIKNHPWPILEYYWECDMGNNKQIESIAKKMNVCLKDVKLTFDKNDIGRQDEKVCYVFAPPFLESMCLDGGIDAMKGDIRKARYLGLDSKDIIQNEDLWEKCELIESHSLRHSSDEFEYHSIFKTGWAYLVENNYVELDFLLISYLKDKIIDLKREQIDEYAGFRFGVNPVSMERINGLMAFRAHPINKNIVSAILNDPIQWEGIFYDRKFCNKSILKYIKTLIPTLEENLFD